MIDLDWHLKITSATSSLFSGSNIMKKKNKG